MTDDSVIIILERRKKESWKKKTLHLKEAVCDQGGRQPLTLKLSGVKKLACVEKDERHDAFKLDLASREGRRIRKSKKS